MPGILVVEDDENLNRGITFSLKKGSITKLVGFRITDIAPPAHVK